MMKTSYYVGFNKKTEPYKFGYMIIDARCVNEARSMFKKIFPDAKKFPAVLTEAQMNRLPVEEFCDAPATCRGKFSIYKEKDNKIFCNVRFNVVFDEEHGIVAAERVAMDGDKNEN